MDILPIVLATVCSILTGGGYLYHNRLQRRKIIRADANLMGSSHFWLEGAIDAIVQTPLRYAEKKEEIENKKQKDQLNLAQMVQDKKLEQQKILNEMKQQEFEIEQQHLALLKQRRDYTLETISTILQYNIDTKTKEMLIRHLLLSFFSMDASEKLDLVDGEE